MRKLLSILASLVAVSWIILLQRRLQTARMRGDMYRDIAVRLDRQVTELNRQGS